jgi:hypothetical protein
MGDWADPGYTVPEKSLKDAVRIRYNEIETELSRLEAIKS